METETIETHVVAEDRPDWSRPEVTHIDLKRTLLGGFSGVDFITGTALPNSQPS